LDGSAYEEILGGPIGVAHSARHLLALPHLARDLREARGVVRMTNLDLAEEEEEKKKKRKREK
jgi:hypothetical protein